MGDNGWSLQKTPNNHPMSLPCDIKDDETTYDMFSDVAAIALLLYNNKYHAKRKQMYPFTLHSTQLVTSAVHLSRGQRGGFWLVNLKHHSKLREVLQHRKNYTTVCEEDVITPFKVKRKNDIPKNDCNHSSSRFASEVNTECIAYSLNTHFIKTASTSVQANECTGIDNKNSRLVIMRLLHGYK